MPHLAEGGQPIQQMGGLPQAPVEQTNTNPGVLENMLSMITGSGNAQAAPPTKSSVTIEPGTVYDYNPKAQQAILEGKIKGGLQKDEGEIKKDTDTNVAQLESTKKEREKAGELIASIGSESLHYKNIESIAQGLIDHAKAHPKDFGYSSQEDSLWSYPLTTIGAIPYAGAPIQEGAEKIKALLEGHGAANRRALSDVKAKQLGMDYVRESLANSGARMGMGLTNILTQAKGVGIAATPEVNIENATRVKYMAKEYQQLAQEWEMYKANNKNPDPLTFLSSAPSRKLQDETQKTIREEIAPYINKPKNGTKGKDIDGNEFVWKDGKPMRIVK
jgi:hypothetical protein